MERGGGWTQRDGEERDKCDRGGMVEEKAGSVRRTGPRDGLMDAQIGALILFCQGLAVTQGPFRINKQEWRGENGRRLTSSPMVSFSPQVSLPPPCYLFSWPEERPITHLLSPPITSSYIMPRGSGTIFPSTAVQIMV